MKSVSRLLTVILGLLAIWGCASKLPKDLFHAGDEVPPDFLTGPASVLLTNVDGFSATVAFSLPATAGQTVPVTGDLLGREGRLIFQPAAHAKKKNNPLLGGMIFIWNVAAHAGYVLSDPLQAYAGMTAGVQGTNLTWDAGAAAQEEANGHPCRRLQAVVQCDDGSSARFIVWQAEDAKHLPVRIRSITGFRQFTLDFSNVRLDLPSQELFVPPDGFTKYATSVALMNELIIRQTELLKSSDHKGEEDTSPNISKWRQGQVQ